MIRRPLIPTLLVAALLSTSAFAQSRLTPKEQYSIDNQRAATRYADDKKLCAEESSSSARMQCTRDAKAEYTKAQANAKAALKAGGADRPAAQAAICNDCGKVLSVNVSEKAGEGSALGLIGGGVAGALLGNQVGGGRGKDLATLAGAAGGAYAGNKVEQKMKASKIWTVAVQYENGAKADFNFDQDPGLAVGDRVKNAGNSIARR
ncbi:glycine zipper 2TM domain-containing protein [Janthinobacterium fluminis]|uniref:Glycine zipper 2TM domain-containing protein n=1 Tax=Janthinobacterium fluminis TaxID=2987524 RepID=A0ABT5JY50_9BURK|nr:glycine zipper 2TM domain-containing protein [Janthinobacterium fluminis]MDC8757401.1 glycine zipper 2TM domain-containing protein [Janthinobacterium fluminis]